MTEVESSRVVGAYLDLPVLDHKGFSFVDSLLDVVIFYLDLDSITKLVADKLEDLYDVL